MLMYIDYGLILAFFAVLIILVLIVMQQRPGAAAHQGNASNNGIPSSQNNKMPYIVLAALFVSLFILAMFVEKEPT